MCHSEMVNYYREKKQQGFNPDCQSMAFSITLRVKMVCVYCSFFQPNDTGALISSALSDWKNIGHLLLKHVGDVHTSLNSAIAEHSENFTNVSSVNNLM